jgi:hypothetical protein
MQVLLDLGSDDGRLAPHFLLRCWHDSDRKFTMQRLRHSDPSQGCQERDVSDPARASQYDRIEKIEAVSVHMEGTDRSAQAHPRLTVVKRLHLLISLGRFWFGNSAAVGPRGRVVPVLRLAFTSPSSVLRRPMLCSWGSRALKRSLLIFHAPSVPISYHHCTHLVPPAHRCFCCACPASSPEMARRAPRACMFCLAH